MLQRSQTRTRQQKDDAEEKVAGLEEVVIRITASNSSRAATTGHRVEFNDFYLPINAVSYLTHNEALTVVRRHNDMGHQFDSVNGHTRIGGE